MDTSWETFTAYPDNYKPTTDLAEPKQEAAVNPISDTRANTDDSQDDGFGRGKRKVVEIDDGWMVTTKQQRPTRSQRPQERTMLTTISRDSNRGKEGGRGRGKPNTSAKTNSRTTNAWETKGGASQKK